MHPEINSVNTFVDEYIIHFLDNIVLSKLVLGVQIVKYTPVMYYVNTPALLALFLHFYACKF